MRKPYNKLSDVRCQTIKDFSDTSNFSDMYHYYSCKALGARRAAIRRIACNCEACDQIIQKPWANGIAAKDQERFKDSEDCYFKSISENENKWPIVDLAEKSNTDEEDIDEIREVTLTHMATSLASSVEVGNIGAFGFEKDDQETTEEDYYLVEFIGKPYLEQQTGTWLVECYWLISVPRARYWYTKFK